VIGDIGALRYVGITKPDGGIRLRGGVPGLTYLGQASGSNRKPQVTIATVNPANGQIIKTFSPLSDGQIEHKIARATALFPKFSRLPLARRAEWMLKAADLLEAEKNELAALMTLEMGKTLRSAVDEAVKSAWVCRYYAQNAASFLADEPIETAASRSFIRYQPLGVVLVVMPWNYPLWQVFRFIAPGLMAGNVGLLKHASNVPQCALRIEELLVRAGFPEGAFQSLLIGPEKVDGLLADPRIVAATLTGSEEAGIKVGAAAASRVKKVVLELGGSDPFIVMPSAPLEETVKAGVKARTLNNGQSCIAAKRFIVAEEIADAFEDGFVRGMRDLRLGNPSDESTDVGPLATERAVASLHADVLESVAAGARILTGGKPANRCGFFYEPTVLTNVPKKSPAYREEFFGPVASIFRAKSIDEAIHIANDTRFGLGASAWTSVLDEQERFINELEAGMVFINQIVASDPRLPFGGVKRSGYGRELSAFGIREFTNIKTVWVK
jgi:succinate-semialdehyde dehydrogenase/glutarate-semialdehyde dehydrogenase